jgi:hypothetical protein
MKKLFSMTFVRLQNFFKFSGYFGRKGSKQSGHSEFVLYSHAFNDIYSSCHFNSASLMMTDTVRSQLWSAISLKKTTIFKVCMLDLLVHLDYFASCFMALVILIGKRIFHTISAVRIPVRVHNKKLFKL